MRVLALSSSRVGNGSYLEAAEPMIKSFLGYDPLTIAFVPFASVDGDYETYVAKVREGLSASPHTIELMTSANAHKTLQISDAIMVGGGNTFKLMHDIYRQKLFAPIQQKVSNGTPYIGWSAGSNIVGKTICTTNDMPIVQPESFTAFGFLPFQINPHYYNVVLEGFHGETRDQRLQEFLILNPDVSVVGLPEGTALRLEEGKLHLLGEEAAVHFQVENGSIRKSKITNTSDLACIMR